MIWSKIFIKNQLQTFGEIRKFRIHTDEELFKKAKCEPLKLISKKNMHQRKYWSVKKVMGILKYLVIPKETITSNYNAMEDNDIT